MSKKIPTYSICNLLGADRCMAEFVAVRLKDFVASHQGLYFPHRHDFYQIVLFTQGGGRHSIDFKHYDIVPNQVYYMAPGQVHSWFFDENTDGLLINFNESFFASVYQNAHYLRDFPLFNTISTSPVNMLDAANYQKMMGVFGQILDEFNANHDYKLEMLRGLLTTLLAALSRVIPNTYKIVSTNHNLVLMRQFEKLIELHFHEKRLPREYAEMMFISPNHLNALTNAMIGVSAGDLIRERVLLEIKRLLINSDLLIGQIADQLNFEDNAYFTRFFKNHTGITPELFRTDFAKTVEKIG